MAKYLQTPSLRNQVAEKVWHSAESRREGHQHASSCKQNTPLKTKIEWSLVFSVYSACVCVLASSLVRNCELPLNLRIMIRRKNLNRLNEWDFCFRCVSVKVEGSATTRFATARLQRKPQKKKKRSLSLKEGA